MISIIWKRVKNNRTAVIGLSVILAIGVLAVGAPLFAPYDSSAIDVDNTLAAPTWSHPLGTDELGRDILSRMIWGGRVSLKVGFVAVGIAISIGIFIGALAGFYGGIIDSLLMRFVDMMLCFPTFFLILAVIAIVEPSITTIMIVIGLTSWMDVSRLVRAEILTLKERDFVLAARAIGARDFRVIFRHILPNVFHLVIIYFTMRFAYAIMTEVIVSYLGLGVQLEPSWGVMISDGQQRLWRGVWWEVGAATGFMFFFVLSLHIAGDALRDILDPRLKT